MTKETNVVINLTSSRSYGRQNMRDIKALLTAPISRIKTLWDDEGRMAKGNAGPVLPDNQIKRHSRMSLSGIPTAFNNAQAGAPRTLRAAASGMTSLLNSINPSPALRAPSPKRKMLCFTTPLPGFAVLPPQGGQRKWHCALKNARGEGNDTRPSSPRSVGMRGIGAPRGFTLLELLVVILIIGILAAIALPQYQLAVKKAQFTKLRVMADSLAKAAHVYYLAHSDWPTTFTDLDLQAPASLLEDTFSTLNGTCGADKDMYCCITYPVYNQSGGQVECVKAEQTFAYRRVFADASTKLFRDVQACLEKNGLGFCQTLPGAQLQNPNTNIFIKGGFQFGYTLYIL